jgi:hypothetical protein
MDRPVTGGKRRIDVLADILRVVLPVEPEARLIAFSDTVVEIATPSELPQPNGSTALHAALQYAAPLNPRRLIIISDGEPDDRGAALRAARAFHCRIDSFHAGDEDDRGAISFLRNLSLMGAPGGRASVTDLRHPDRLAGALRLLLAAPRR